MSNYRTICKIKAASVKARERANARWTKDRAMRDRLAAMEPSRFLGRIVRRVIVIDNETTAREIVLYDFDNYTDRKRKMKTVKELAIP